MLERPSVEEAQHRTGRALDKPSVKKEKRCKTERWTGRALEQPSTAEAVLRVSHESQSNKSSAEQAEQPSAGVAERRDIKRWADGRKRIGALETPSIGEAELRSGRLPRHQTLDGRAQEHLNAGEAER